MSIGEEFQPFFLVQVVNLEGLAGSGRIEGIAISPWRKTRNVDESSMLLSLKLY
jgi:hypothetical protein